MTTVDSLRKLYVAMGGSLADVAEMNTDAELINACSNIYSGGGSSSLYAGTFFKDEEDASPAFEFSEGIDLDMIYEEGDRGRTIVAGWEDDFSTGIGNLYWDAQKGAFVGVTTHEDVSWLIAANIEDQDEMNVYWQAAMLSTSYAVGQCGIENNEVYFAPHAVYNDQSVTSNTDWFYDVQTAFYNGARISVYDHYHDLILILSKVFSNDESNNKVLYFTGTTFDSDNNVPASVVAIVNVLTTDDSLTVEFAADTTVFTTDSLENAILDITFWQGPLISENLSGMIGLQDLTTSIATALSNGATEIHIPVGRFGVGGLDINNTYKSASADVDGVTLVFNNFITRTDTFSDEDDFQEVHSASCSYNFVNYANNYIIPTYWSLKVNEDYTACHLHMYSGLNAGE